MFLSIMFMTILFPFSVTFHFVKIIYSRFSRGSGDKGPSFPTFVEFVHWLIAIDITNTTTNVHWQPISSYCRYARGSVTFKKAQKIIIVKPESKAPTENQQRV